ncbi:LPS export ABC transporter periplasmic protein LptC [Bordetella genomosp. 11]|uniref:LPS export ABC transporter periplasmic protein LptC n=1 Tax=Bordetella genomosp. 11 TaxID=1416808 RepID=A0A261UYV4_9BORD|nr:LPS export ABC transporter periplasmic protein LptC [Bordetella genomosp. 11]OZI66460.1 LPS export ABC transporter periplasmic protein LptC [Bordetella genomosp. 11]
MKERFPSLIALFLLLALVLGTWWAADYTQRAVPTDPPRRLTHEMDAWSRNFVMVRTGQDGKPINRMEGDYGEHYPDDDSYVVTDPRAVGLRPNTPITVATSETATMYEGGKRIVMDKNAHMHRQPDADTPPLDVRSEQLVILPDDDTISTTLPALVTRGQSRMNGTGMKYNNKTRQLEVFSSTNVEIAPADTQHTNSKDKPKDQSKPADGSPAPRTDTQPPARTPAASAQAPAHASVKKQ